MNKTAPHTPLYLSLYQLLRTKIESGDYPVGSKLPTEMQIARQYNVSRVTSRHALDRLAEEGYIQRYAGKGSYILSRTAVPPAAQAAAKPAPASRLIGVVMEGIHPAFGIDMLFGIEHQCAEAGYSIILKFSYGDEERERACIEELLQEGVSGIILMCVYNEVYNPTIMKLALEGFPLIFLDRSLSGLPIPYVGTPHYEAARQITHQLVSMNHTHLALAMAEGPSNTSSADSRIQGYVQCCLEHNLLCGSRRLILIPESLLAPSAEARAENIRRTKDYLQQNPETTAFVALRAEIAEAVIQALNEMPPRRFAIASFDGPCETLHMPYDLLYVQQNQKRIGELGAIRLMEKIKGCAVPLATCVPYEIIVCSSASVPCVMDRNV